MDLREGRLKASLGVRRAVWQSLGVFLYGHRLLLCRGTVRAASSWHGWGQVAPPAEKAVRVEKLELFLLM